MRIALALIATFLLGTPANGMAQEAASIEAAADPYMLRSNPPHRPHEPPLAEFERKIGALGNSVSSHVFGVDFIGPTAAVFPWLLLNLGLDYSEPMFNRIAALKIETSGFTTALYVSDGKNGRWYRAETYGLPVPWLGLGVAIDDGRTVGPYAEFRLRRPALTLIFSGMETLHDGPSEGDIRLRLALP